MPNRLWGAVASPDTFIDEPPTWSLALALAASASLAIATYGFAVHLADGSGAALWGALRALFCAGAAWMLAVPALVVLGALLRSPVAWRRAVQASLVTVHFGGMAFVASIPVIWLLDVASPVEWTHALVNALVVIGVGGCSTLIFERTMARLEGRRFLHRLWMVTFGVLFVELAWLVDLFRFA